MPSLRDLLHRLLGWDPPPRCDQAWAAGAHYGVHLTCELPRGHATRRRGTVMHWAAAPAELPPELARWYGEWSRQMGADTVGIVWYGDPGTLGSERPGHRPPAPGTSGRLTGPASPEGAAHRPPGWRLRFDGTDGRATWTDDAHLHAPAPTVAEPGTSAENGIRAPGETWHDMGPGHDPETCGWCTSLRRDLGATFEDSPGASAWDTLGTGPSPGVAWADGLGPVEDWGPEPDRDPWPDIGECRGHDTTRRCLHCRGVIAAPGQVGGAWWAVFGADPCPAAGSGLHAPGEPVTECGQCAGRHEHVWARGRERSGGVPVRCTRCGARKCDRPGCVGRRHHGPGVSSDGLATDGHTLTDRGFLHWLNAAAPAKTPAVLEREAQAWDRLGHRDVAAGIRRAVDADHVRDTAAHQRSGMSRGEVGTPPPAETWHELPARWDAWGRTEPFPRQVQDIPEPVPGNPITGDELAVDGPEVYRPRWCAGCGIERPDVQRAGAGGYSWADRCPNCHDTRPPEHGTSSWGRIEQERATGTMPEVRHVDTGPLVLPDPPTEGTNP